MKRFLLLPLALALCSGCSTPYSITLNDGEVITARGKPAYDQARSGYLYTDSSGNPSYVSQVRVREIEPQSWEKKSDPKDFKFLPSPGAQ